MAHEIDADQVRHVAKLARLNLTEGEVHLFSSQLGEILNYFKQLDEVDTTGVEPMAHALPITNVLREDDPGPCFTPEQALANAPARQGDFFKVPAVLDQSGA